MQELLKERPRTGKGAFNTMDLNSQALAACFKNNYYSCHLANTVCWGVIVDRHFSGILTKL